MDKHKVTCTTTFRYSPLCLQIAEKLHKCEIFWPPLFGDGRTRLFYSKLLARFTVYRLAKCD